MKDSTPTPDSQRYTAERPVRMQELMRHRVHHILLVSSLYDSFILAEDGQLNEAILNQFLALNMSSNPDLARVSSGAEALSLLREPHRFDLVITSTHVGDMDAAELARRVRDEGSDVPVILLAYSNRELTDFRASTTRKVTTAFIRRVTLSEVMNSCPATSSTFSRRSTWYSLKEPDRFQVAYRPGFRTSA